MKYLQKSFSVNVGGKDYADGWDRVFGQQAIEATYSGSLIPEYSGGFDVEPDDWFPASDIRRQVEEFHHVMGLPVGDKPEVPPTDRVHLRLNLIAEEFLELLEACGAQKAEIETLTDEIDYVIGWLRAKDVNLVEVADALADLDYVNEGMRLEFGINGAPIAAEVHRSNMSKVGPGGVVERREDGKVIKPANWSPPDIRQCLIEQGWKDES